MGKLERKIVVQEALADRRTKPLLGALNWTSRWYHPRAGEPVSARRKMAESIADFVVAGLVRT
jgi:hypothetical protein